MITLSRSISRNDILRKIMFWMHLFDWDANFEMQRLDFFPWWSYRWSLFFLLIDHFLKRATTTTTTTTKAVPETKKPIGPVKLIEDVHVIKGFLKLPNKGDWSSLTHLSCMQVHLYPVDFVCNEGHCPQHILFSTRAMVTDVTEYKVEYHLKVFNLAKGKYLIR